MPRGSEPAGKSKCLNHYANRRMSKKDASSAARDMRSGDKDAAKYMSSYRKHVQSKRSQEAVRQAASSSNSTSLPTSDQIEVSHRVSDLPHPE